VRPGASRHWLIVEDDEAMPRPAQVVACGKSGLAAADDHDVDVVVAIDWNRFRDHGVSVRRAVR
jgi:hypothetical protein